MRRSVSDMVICRTCPILMTQIHFAHCDNEFMIPALTPEAASADFYTQVSVMAKLSHLDPRMIRDGDVDDEAMGFERRLFNKAGIVEDVLPWYHQGIYIYILRSF